MNDEAAESRGPATTGTGPSQDAPAPSPAPESADEPTAHIPPVEEPTAHIPPPDDPPVAAEPPPAFDPPPWFGANGPTFTRERLVRPSQGRYVAGVCAAIGRATNTDPVLWRVLLVVLGLFGGVGVLIYLIGWLGITAEGDTASPVESLLGRGRSRMTPLSVMLLAVGAVLTFAFIVHDGFRATVLGGAVLVGVVLLIRRNTGNNPESVTTPAAAPPPPAAPAAGSGPGFPFAPMDRTAAFATSGAPATEPLPPQYQAPQYQAPPPPPQYQAPQFTPPPPDDYRQPFAPHGPYASRQQTQPPPAPRPPKPKREKSKLGRITFFALLMVLGVLALFDVGGASVPVSGYFAAALATIGLGLIVGAWFGRARGLIALALVTALGLGISAGAERFGGQIANSDYTPQSLAEVADRYDFKVGSTTLDLRAVDFAGASRDVTVSMSVGQVRVLLPEKVDTTASVTMDGGRAVVFGREYDGNANNAISVTDTGTDGTGGGTLRLTVQVKTGDVEVSR